MFNVYQKAAIYNIVTKSSEGSTANDEFNTLKTLLAGANYSGPPPPIIRISPRVMVEVARITKMIEEYERQDHPETPTILFRHRLQEGLRPNAELAPSAHEEYSRSLG